MMPASGIDGATGLIARLAAAGVETCYRGSPEDELGITFRDATRLAIRLEVAAGSLRPTRAMLIAYLKHEGWTMRGRGPRGTFDGWEKAGKTIAVWHSEDMCIMEANSVARWLAIACNRHSPEEVTTDILMLSEGYTP